MNIDNISDTFTRIRNAHLRGNKTVKVLLSKPSLAISKLLLEEGYLTSVDDNTEKERYLLVLGLKYYRKKPVIEHIKRISSPGKRVYVSAKNIHSVRSNLGIAIISTSRGMLSGAEAKQLGIGGELIGEVY